MLRCAQFATRFLPVRHPELRSLTPRLSRKASRPIRFDRKSGLKEREGPEGPLSRVRTADPSACSFGECAIRPCGSPPSGVQRMLLLGSCYEVCDCDWNLFVGHVAIGVCDFLPIPWVADRSPTRGKSPAKFVVSSRVGVTNAGFREPRNSNTMGPPTSHSPGGLQTASGGDQPTLWQGIRRKGRPVSLIWHSLDAKHAVPAIKRKVTSQLAELLDIVRDHLSHCSLISQAANYDDIKRFV